MALKENFGTIGAQSTAGAIPSYYIYTTEEAHTAVDASGYFNDLSDLLSVGDMICVHGSTGGTRTVTITLLSATHLASLISVTAPPLALSATPID